MAVRGAASAPAVRGPLAPLLCRAPHSCMALLGQRGWGGGLKRPGRCSGGGLGEANEFRGLDSCRDGGRRAPAPWPWKGGSLPGPKEPGPPTPEPKCRGRRSRPPSSNHPPAPPLLGGARSLRFASKLKAAPRWLALAASLGGCFQRRLPVWLAGCGLWMLLRVDFTPAIRLPWLERTRLPDPCLTPSQATCKILGAKDGKKQAGGQVLSTPLSLRERCCQVPGTRRFLTSRVPSVCTTPRAGSRGSS